MKLHHFALMGLSTLIAFPAAAEAPAPGLWQVTREFIGQPPAMAQMDKADKTDKANKTKPADGKPEWAQGDRRRGKGPQGERVRTLCLTASDDPNQVFFNPPRRHQKEDAPPPCKLSYLTQVEGSASWTLECEGPGKQRQGQGQAQFGGQDYSGSMLFKGRDGQSEHGFKIVANRIGDCPATPAKGTAVSDEGAAE